MEPTELINVLQSHLDTEVSAPVLVSGSDKRPTPSVYIEDWTVDHLTSSASMNRYLTSLYDDQGNETARVFRIPYECRVSLMVRDVGTVSASTLNDKVHKELFKLESRPSKLDSRVSEVELGNSVGVDHQFLNPSEDEFSLAVNITTSLTYADSDYDTIEAITQEIEIIDEL